jgi:hypothetical protein
LLAPANRRLPDRPAGRGRAREQRAAQQNAKRRGIQALVVGCLPERRSTGERGNRR